MADEEVTSMCMFTALFVTSFAFSGNIFSFLTQIIAKDIPDTISAIGDVDDKVNSISN